MAPAEPEAGDDNPEKAAVEGHAAFPDLQDFNGMREVIARLVEEHVAEPAAKDDAEDDRGQEVFDPRRLHRRGIARPEMRTLHQRDDDAPADDQPDDIGEGIEAQRQIPAEKRNGDPVRDVGKACRGEHRASFRPLRDPLPAVKSTLSLAGIMRI